MQLEGAGAGAEGAAVEPPLQVQVQVRAPARQEDGSQPVAEAEVVEAA